MNNPFITLPIGSKSMLVNVNHIVRVKSEKGSIYVYFVDGTHEHLDTNKSYAEICSLINGFYQ